MTQKQRESLYRALGIIEGAYFTASEDVKNALSCASIMIESVLDEEKGEKDKT